MPRSTLASGRAIWTTVPSSTTINCAMQMKTRAFHRRGSGSAARVGFSEAGDPDDGFSEVDMKSEIPTCVVVPRRYPEVCSAYSTPRQSRRTVSLNGHKGHASAGGTRRSHEPHR
ncbi:Uncharacterised protein [Mycobacteroides abscessus subsp. abscessus]|nr:Uncharacterised protein [Mycobacteroides abscessus subsp. abscessus]